jgi:hypothetical protein
MSQADLATFQRIIEGILGDSNEVRKQAEQAYEKCLASTPDHFIGMLVQMMRASPRDNVRIHARFSILHDWRASH